jgi:hypothetical protein
MVSASANFERAAEGRCGAACPPACPRAFERRHGRVAHRKCFGGFLLREETRLAQLFERRAPRSALAFPATPARRFDC